MMVQIPVENALKHGLMPLMNNDMKLKIKVSKDNNFLSIEVIDNGVGLSGELKNSSGTGTGLKVMMQTIHFLNSAKTNKNKISFKLIDRKGNDMTCHGVIASLDIPVDFIYYN
jgi:LytS/YehU family sensor histidine kinase